MTGSQHSSYLRLDALPQLPVVPFSPTHHSPLHLHDSSYQATQHYPTQQVIPGAPLHQHSSSTSATFGNLSLTTNNLHAVEAQPPSAGGPHTPAHSALVSPYGPVSPSEVFATPDQLLTPYHQAQSFGVFDSPQAVQALTVLAAQASPHSSNSLSSGSSRAQSHPHSSPNAPPYSPLHPHPSSSQAQLNLDVLSQAQPASSHDVPPHSAVEQQQQQQSLTLSRIDGFIQQAQELRNRAQVHGFELSGQSLDRLQGAFKDLWSEVPVAAYQGDNNQAHAQAYTTPFDVHTPVHTLTHDHTNEHDVFSSLHSGSGYNQFQPQVDYAQTAAAQGMHMHASASVSGLHLDALNHGLPPHTV